ncbi:MAG: hypothetical protein ACTSRE_10345 [Promethearchaeota archaeon]
MGASEGRRALRILIGSIIGALLIMGGLFTYVPSIRPYLYTIFIVIVFGIGFGACIVLNAYGGTGIKRAEKY